MVPLEKDHEGVHKKLGQLSCAEFKEARQTGENENVASTKTIPADSSRYIGSVSDV